MNPGKLILVILLPLLMATSLKAQWRGLEVNDSVISYNDVQFLNPDTAYIAIDEGYLYPRPNKRIYRTTNGGNSWELIDSMFTLTYFHYFDYNHAIFAAGDLIDRSQYGQPGAKSRVGLWYSKDGGRTRDSIPNTYKFSAPLFISNKIGFTVKPSFYYPYNYFNEGPIYKTKDGGMTWYKVSDAPIQTRMFYFPSDTLVGYAGYTTLEQDTFFILKTTDAGEHWNNMVVELLPKKRDNSEAWLFITKDIILHSYNSSATISRDGGKSWKNTYFPRPRGLENFTFTDTSTVYASNNGYIAKDSTGTGFFWTYSDFSDSIVNFSFYFLKERDFAYAYTPYWNSTKIFVNPHVGSWSGTVTPVEKRESVFHDEALEIFPNPARYASTLKGFGFRPGKVQIALRDMLGRIVFEVNAEASTSGTIETHLDLEGLSPAMYQAEVIQGTKREVKKIIIR